MPDSQEILGIPFKMSDEPRPRMITADSILWISNGEEEMELPLRMVVQSRRMYELLKELEWAKVDCRDESIDVCPSCNNLECFGHEPVCRLAAVLKAVEGT